MATGFDAKTDATDIGNAAKTKGPEGADQSFRAELDEISKADSSAGDKTQLYTQLNTELEQRGILPEMAVNWAKTNLSKLDKDGNGGITFDEIAFATQFSQQGSAERAYLESLGNNYGTLVNQVKYENTGSRGGQTSVNGISGKDLDAFLSGKKDGRTNLDLASMLTDNKDFLFNSLDVAKTGLDDKDGKVSRSDIETFTKALDTNKDGKIADDELNNEQLLGGVDKDERRKVADTLMFLKDQKNWDSDAVKRLRDGDVITMDSMAKGLGFKSGDKADVNAMKEAVKGLTGDDPNQDRVEAATSTTAAEAPGMQLTEWQKEAIEGYLTKYPETTALVSDNGKVTKEKLDAFLNGIKDNREEAHKYHPDVLVALGLLQQGWKSVSPDGAPIDVAKLSNMEFNANPNNTQPSGSDTGDSGASTEAPTDAETPDTFVVRPGDSIWKIAQEKLGPQASNQQIADLMNAILQANKMSPESYIYAGDKLIIPKV